MRYALTAAAAAFFMSACTTGPLSTTDSLLLACSGYDATLRTLAGYAAAGRLSADDIATVDRVRPFLNDACDGDMPATGDLLDRVEAALLEMILIERAVQ